MEFFLWYYDNIFIQISKVPKLLVSAICLQNKVLKNPMSQAEFDLS